jgi:hypothetical protein
MNAADVLTTAHEGWARQSDGPPWADLGEWLTAALLAHGGPYGVTVTQAGKAEAAFGPSPDEAEAIRKVLDCGCHPDLRAFLGGALAMADRLVPLSAGAGDQGTWMGGGLEITYPSAEAGDTDG